MLANFRKSEQAEISPKKRKNKMKRNEFSCCKAHKVKIIYQAPADMAELVDALVSGTSGSNALEVRVFLSAPVLGL